MLNRKKLRNWRAWLIATAALAVCTTTATLTGVLPASAATQRAHESTVRVVTAKVSRLPALPAGVKPASTLPSCLPGIDSYNRSHECWLQQFTFTFYNGDHVKVGTLDVDLEQYMTLVANSSKWSEQDEVLAAIPEGTTAPVEFTLFATCGLYCGADVHFGPILKEGLKGSVSYSTTVPKNAMFTASTDYILLYAAPPFIPENFGSWSSPWDYRCDNGVATAGTGCVVPAFTPTLDISRGTYGAAAAMIQWSQEALKTHWGVEGKGEPLRRMKNTKVADQNRRVICQTDWTAFAPWKAGSVTMKDSCDEFPFAASYESGARNGVTSGAACAQVKAVKTSSQGDNPAKLWNDIDVISYSPNDKCVRGHIPLKLNTDVGNKAYLALIRQARLINNDPFWVAVTK